MKKNDLPSLNETCRPQIGQNATQEITDGIQRKYDCSLSEALSITTVLCIGKGKKNPTIDQLIQTILESIRSKSPLNLWMSQCIGKKPEVRQKKLDFFCKPEVEKPRNVPLKNGAVEGLESKCWNELRTLQNEINARVILLLGDQDFFTLDAIGQWASPKTIIKLQQDLDFLLRETQEKATQFFGTNVSIIRWTSLYNIEEFNQELVKAKQTKDQWLVGKLKRASERPYYQSWQYPSLAQERGISESTLEQFIEDDIIRTAAQYRVESRIAMRRNAVQCWAETCGDPIWPIKISNYDQTGVPPSIPLL